MRLCTLLPRDRILTPLAEYLMKIFLRAEKSVDKDIHHSPCMTIQKKHALGRNEDPIPTCKPQTQKPRAGEIHDNMLFLLFSFPDSPGSLPTHELWKST